MFSYEVFASHDCRFLIPTDRNAIKYIGNTFPLFPCQILNLAVWAFRLIMVVWFPWPRDYAAIETNTKKSNLYFSEKYISE